jgi:hypothetical protein
MTGNPARQRGWMSEYGHRLNFDDDGMAECPESGEKYKLEMTGSRKDKPIDQTINYIILQA